MKIDFPEQYQRPNHETHEGGQNINKLKVTTKASTTTSTNSPTYYYGLERTYFIIHFNLCIQKVRKCSGVCQVT